ncbi:unnamed protein product [Fraxinus pennsylvanica]|uniref:ABC transporter domain-containing protein n=1 Tax=Fraxinus pennsylvanica TaxID=56036 RepID=A0AAD2A9W1_9LAMI|nr:unnamed protein product [Fraxinus pennsylvanica]
MEIEMSHPGSSSNGGGDVEKGGGGVVAGAAYLAWEDLTVVLPNFGNGPTKRLLNEITGYALPGRIMAVMGPSGSGKSTLLDSLAGRLSGNVIMTGNVLLNGRKKRLNYGGVAYVTQEDVFLGTLTVRETITYSAQLRLPSNITKDEANEIIENTIIEMGLQECADQIIGNWHVRGISGGEKKRLSIAVEILTQPRILFLDEPTSGLDSASSFFVVQALKNVACSGRTIVASIHQPSSEVFALFDDLLLLSCGEKIYFGEAKMAIEGFKNFSGPSINLTTEEIRARLLQKYKCSNYAARARSRIQEISTYTEGFEIEKTRGSQATRWKQLSTLTMRSFTNMSRDFGYYWLRIIVYIVVSICVGSVFHDVGTDYHSILARGACGGFISGFMTFMSIGGFPSFIEEMKIFSKERLNGHYGVGLFTLSNFISSFPFLVMMSFSSASITYFIVKFHPGLSHFMFATLDLLISIAVVESSMLVVASVVPNFLMGVVIGAGFIGIMMATSGFFRLPNDLPKPFWRYPISYINYMAWALQGAYKNDMIGIEFEPMEVGGPKLKGEYILTSMIGMSLKHSKWWDLAVVTAILLANRFLFFAILKLKEKAVPKLRTIYAKRTLHHLNKRPSFRKTPPFHSKREHIVHSLSSQEGLNSPLH